LDFVQSSSKLRKSPGPQDRCMHRFFSSSFGCGLAGKLIVEQQLFVDKDQDSLGALLLFSILLGWKVGLVATILIHRSGHHLVAIIEEGLQHMPPAQMHSWNTIWMHKMQRRGFKPSQRAGGHRCNFVKHVAGGDGALRHALWGLPPPTSQGLGRHLS
jgi:hypothetical protein